VIEIKIEKLKNKAILTFVPKKLEFFRRLKIIVLLIFCLDDLLHDELLTDLFTKYKIDVFYNRDGNFINTSEDSEHAK